MEIPSNEVQQSRRPRRVRRAFGAAVLASLVLLGFFWAFAHRDDPRFINYAAAFIPVVLSVLIAFVPDLRKAHIAWRIAIVGIGLIWSILLWRQQELADKAQSEALAKVMDDLKAVEKHTDTQIGVVRSDLKNSTQALASQVSKTSTDLTSTLNGLKPPSPELAKITFSFFVTQVERFPLLIQPIRIGEDGTYAVDFIAENVASVQARSVEIWIQICGACSYAQEIEGFGKMTGQDEHVRRRVFADVNPGTFSPKVTVRVKIPEGFASFDTSFSYSCANCGSPKLWNQTLKTIILH